MKVSAGPHVELEVFKAHAGRVDAMLWNLSSNTQLAFICADRARVAFSGNDITGIWFERINVKLPLASTLAVADLLGLEIPLPVPLGQQVPA